MSEHFHATIARTLWRATSESDAQTLRDMLSPDITWRTQSSGALSGALHGPEAVLDLFARSGELVDSLTSELLSVYANDEGAVLHYRVQAERGPFEIDSEVLLKLEITDGVVMDAVAVPIDLEGTNAFWRPQ